MSEDLYTLFRSRARQQEGAVAVYEAGGQVTFAHLLRLVDAIAATFPPAVKTVGLVMSHSATMVAAILAVLKAGARYVPAEPDFPPGRIRYMMEEAQADFVLTEEAYAERLAGLALRFLPEDIGERQPSVSDQAVGVDPSRPAYVLYTSGTTGRPKGVCVTQANVCHYVRAFAQEFHPGPGDVMLQYSVCSFDIFVEEVFASLLNGAALAIPGPEDRADMRALMAFVEAKGVTIISGFPYLLAELNRLEKIPSCLRLLISGGDVLRGVYVDRLLAQAEVYNSYGPSETTVCASYYHCNPGAVLADGTYPIGKAVKGAALRLLDQDGCEVGEGERGEICISGGGVALGYIGDHGEENRAFAPQPDGSLLYHSGDLGYRLPDGNLAFLRRQDDQIMIYGKRVEVAEVESRLYQCPEVGQALVRAFTDERGLAYMIAYIVPATEELKLSSLRKALAQNLPPFMIPEFVVRLPQLPLNANGKPALDRLPVVLKEGTV